MKTTLYRVVLENQTTHKTEASWWSPSKEYAEEIKKKLNDEGTDAKIETKQA